MKKQKSYMIILSILIIGTMVGSYIVYSNMETLEDWNQNLFSHGSRLEGNGNIVSNERTIEGFDTVVLDGIGDVNIYPGENYKVVITTDSNVQDNVISIVNGDTLHIDQKQKSFNSKEMTIDIYMPDLKNVSLKGIGEIKIYNGSATNLEISLSGTGNIDAENFKSENVIVTLSGTGNISLWASQTLEGKLSGIGNIDALKNPIENGNIILSGTGDITIWVTETLKGELSGVGNILYKGNPKIRDVEIRGIGSVTPYN